MKYDELGNKIVASKDNDGFIMIDFSKLKGGWSNGSMTERSRPDNDNGESPDETWTEFFDSLPESPKETPPVDLRRKKRVLDAVENMDIFDEAKQFRVDRDKPPFEPLEVFDGDDFLEQDDNPVGYKIADLWPNGSNVLFAAPAKFGKSTVMMNMIRSLLTGEAFLGHFDVQRMPEDEAILLVDMEMNPDRVRSELRFHLAPLPREQRRALKVACIRGQISKFDITNAEVRADLVKNCLENNVKTLILDPLAPLLGMLNIDENDNTMINRFFQQLDEFKLEAGIHDMIVVHHCGHMADYRPRGASRFNDWPDALWGAKLTDPNDPVNTTRMFHARGRDVGEHMGGPGEIKRDPNNSKILHFSAGASSTSQADTAAIGKLDNYIYTNSGKSTPEILAWAESKDGQGNKQIDFEGKKIRELLRIMVSTGQLHMCSYKKGAGRGAPSDHYAPDMNRCGKTPPCQPSAD